MTLLVALLLLAPPAQNLEMSEEEARPLLLEADRVVARLLSAAAARRYRVEPVTLRPGEAGRTGVAARMDIRELEPADRDSGPRWVASVNLRGQSPSGSNAFLRLYGRRSGQVTLLASESDSPLMKAARTEKGLAGHGNLGWCLQYDITGMSETPRTREDSRPGIQVAYAHLWGG